MAKNWRTEQRCSCQSCLQAVEMNRKFQKIKFWGTPEMNMYETFLSLCFKEMRCFQEHIIGICEPKYLQMRRQALRSLQKHRQIIKQAPICGSPYPSFPYPISFIPKGGRKTVWKARGEVSKDSAKNSNGMTNVAFRIINGSFYLSTALFIIIIF